MTSPAPEDQRDVFEEVFALLTPDRLLRDPRATGEGIKVCVIDSGIEQTILRQRFGERGHDLHRIEGGIFTSDRPEPLPYEGHQSTPHGTTVAGIILARVGLGLVTLLIYRLIVARWRLVSRCRLVVQLARPGIGIVRIIYLVM